jgi:hypothetical protein
MPRALGEQPVPPRSNPPYPVLITTVSLPQACPTSFQPTRTAAHCRHTIIDQFINNNNNNIAFCPKQVGAINSSSQEKNGTLSAETPATAISPLGYWSIGEIEYIMLFG